VTGRVRTAALVLGVVGVVGGVLGFLESAGQPFTAPEGARVGALFHLNPLGSAVAVALGAVTLAGAWSRQRAVTLAASAGWLVAALLTVAQAGREVNLLGGTGSTLAFFLGLGAGLLALAIAPDEVGPGQAAPVADGGVAH
jgi:hypothetical protein